MRTEGAVTVILSGLVGLAPAAAQPDFETKRAALREIRETAADICYTVEQRGRKNEAQLTGEVQAKVNGALARLADLGVKGSGQIGSMEYQGLSQEAVGTAITASLNCRRSVFDKLVDRMLPSRAASSPTGRPSDVYAPPRQPNPAFQQPMPYQPPQIPWQNTGDPRAIAHACDQGSSEACHALVLYAKAGCQMGKQDDCALTNRLLSMGYR